MVRVPRLGIVLATAAMPAARAGGGAIPDEPDVRPSLFFVTLSARQGDKACADLAPQAVRRFPADGLARKIEEPDLSRGTIRPVRAWGDRAQAAGTVFLVRLPQGWGVAAAGCGSQAEGLYDRAVEV
jgi:hypothetical protein